MNQTEINRQAVFFASAFATELYEWYLNDKNYHKNTNWKTLSNTRSITKISKLLEQNCPNTNYHILVENFYYDMRKMLKSDYYYNFCNGDTDTRVIWRVYSQVTNFMPYKGGKDRPELYLLHSYNMYEMGIINYKNFNDYREWLVLCLISFGHTSKSIKGFFNRSSAKKILPMDLLNSL